MFKTAVTRGEKELVRSERSLKQCPRDSVQDERRGLEKREICLVYQNKENAGGDWGRGDMQLGGHYKLRWLWKEQLLLDPKGGSESQKE